MGKDGRMRKQPINPWQWQESYGYCQAWKIDTPKCLIFTSGQASISRDGAVLHAGDPEAQIRQTFANLETVLNNAGASLQEIVKMGIYLTDIQHFPVYRKIQEEVLQDVRPANTVLVVQSLALPELLVEIEAIAAI